MELNTAMAGHLNAFIFPAGYLMGVIFACKAAWKIKAAAEGAPGSSMGAAVLCGAAAVALLGLPSIITKKLAEDQAAQEARSLAGSQIVAHGSGSAKREVPAPIAKPAAKSLDKAAPPIIPIKLEKLDTPEEARASADRQALGEVLLGFAVALAGGIGAWAMAKRRRRASARSAPQLPEVVFMDEARSQAATFVHDPDLEPKLLDGGGDLFAGAGMGILARPKMQSSIE